MVLLWKRNEQFYCKDVTDQTVCETSWIIFTELPRRADKFGNAKFWQVVFQVFSEPYAGQIAFVDLVVNFFLKTFLKTIKLRIK